MGSVVNECHGDPGAFWNIDGHIAVIAAVEIVAVVHVIIMGNHH